MEEEVEAVEFAFRGLLISMSCGLGVAVVLPSSREWDCVFRRLLRRSMSFSGPLKLKPPDEEEEEEEKKSRAGSRGSGVVGGLEGGSSRDAEMDDEGVRGVAGDLVAGDDALFPGSPSSGTVCCEEERSSLAGVFSSDSGGASSSGMRRLSTGYFCVRGRQKINDFSTKKSMQVRDWGSWLTF